MSGESMSFDETNIKRIDIDRAFKAGAQSRQAEIDELKQRVDEALSFYNIAKSDVNIGMMQMAIYLKGKENEN